MAAAKSTTFSNMPHRNGTYVGSYACGGSADVTPDLHLKMSKKIAQLTKVVYALNTKNDEHDSIVECLKEKHEEDMKRFLDETKSRLSELQLRIVNNEKQKKDVEHVEQLLLEEKENGKDILKEFERFKICAKEKEEMLWVESEEKATLNVKQLLEVKNNFEKQLKSLKETREILEKDKDNAIEDLVRNHHEELDQLMKAHRVRYDEVLKEKEKLHQELEGKIKDLTNSPETLRTERQRLENEYKTKLEKLKTLYERELLLAKETTAKAESSVKVSQQKESDLRNSWKNQEKQYKDRISALRKELNTSKDLALNLENRLLEVENEVTLKSEGSDETKQRLNNALKDVNDLTTELRTTKSEMEVTQKRCEGLTDELSIKTRSLRKLDATCMNQEQAVSKMKGQLNTLKEKCDKLEANCKFLEDNKQTLASDSQQQIEIYRQNIEKLEQEKQDIKFKYLKELVITKEETAKNEKSLKTFQEQQVCDLEKKHKQSFEELEKTSKASLTKQAKELEKSASEEREQLLKEREEMAQEKEEKLMQLQKLYEQSCCQVERLSGLVQESDVGLGSASTRISSLNSMVQQKQTEINSLQKELTITGDVAKTLQEELEGLQKSYDKTTEQAKEKVKGSLEDLRKQLDKEWSERLKSECSLLRARLNEQHEDGQHVALEQLSSLKEKEKDEILQNSEKNIALLQSKITRLERDLKETSSQFTKSERTFRESANHERRRLEEERAREANDYNVKINEIEAKHNDEITALQETKEEELKALEVKLKRAHEEDTLLQLKASLLSVEVVRSHEEQKRRQTVAEERTKFENEKHVFSNELLRRRKEEMAKIKKDFEHQLRLLKLQVEKTDELRSEETESHARQVEELSETIHKNQLQINELSREISEGKMHATQLQREIEAKGQEILSVRREANSHIRKSEERLAKVHQNEMDSSTAEHLRETQNMVHEFNRAQELLKDKVSALQIMLEEAESRYRNRPSRDEDIEIIQSVKFALSERELELKKMLDEKRYYQLELLNRETNFNKVFKAAPNIGVINPLQYKKKPSKDQPHGQSSGMMLSSSRLQPMPMVNMSAHEKKLNQNSPLPPAPPKKLGETKRTTVY